MSIESQFTKELEMLEAEYAEGLIDFKTYNRRLSLLERARNECCKEE